MPSPLGRRREGDLAGREAQDDLNGAGRGVHSRGASLAGCDDFPRMMEAIRAKFAEGFDGGVGIIRHTRRSPLAKPLAKSREERSVKGGKVTGREARP
jgi:hypothetical protein